MPILKILLTTVALFLFSACQSKETKTYDTNTTAQDPNASMSSHAPSNKISHNKSTLSIDHNSSKLEELGIKVEGSKVIIDTNKTKQFFKQVTKQLQSKVVKIEKELQKGVVEEKDMGIEINKSEVKVDLNKTTQYLKKWKDKIEGLVKDLSDTSSEKLPHLETGSTNTTNTLAH